ncbi:hypothetical protein PHMEG_00015979 [Phytophthora megakarya]|uniref:Tf2-1-like SH3-like domain-containing protein n=1 Tax=Phytophthora megakarya TaxID=4795 RepID=A0A225W0E2_9STRA|nr:hypothetical protein PHMEG_00015979 [Phytophthora megakarya]
MSRTRTGPRHEAHQKLKAQMSLRDVTPVMLVTRTGPDTYFENSSLDIPDAEKSTPTSTWNRVPRCLDAAETPVSTQANFNHVLVPQPQDAAAVNKFVQERGSVVLYVRDAIAAAVDRQNGYWGRKNLEKVVSSVPFTNTALAPASRFCWKPDTTVAVVDRVLLSTAGIQPAAVTNALGPQFFGPFQLTKILGDAYTLRLPTALRLHPTFYVGRLRRYHPATIPSDADDPPAARRLVLQLSVQQFTVLIPQHLHVTRKTIQTLRESSVSKPITLHTSVMVPHPCARVHHHGPSLRDRFAPSREPSLKQLHYLFVLSGLNEATAIVQRPPYQRLVLREAVIRCRRGALRRARVVVSYVQPRFFFFTSTSYQE